jgi:hypothetical protein
VLHYQCFIYVAEFTCWSPLHEISVLHAIILWSKIMNEGLDNNEL